MASASSLAAAPRRWLVPSARAAHSRARLVTLLLAGAARRSATGPAGRSSNAAAGEGAGGVRGTAGVVPRSVRGPAPQPPQAGAVVSTRAGWASS